MNINELASFIHRFTPHNGDTIYLVSMVCGACAALFVYMRCAIDGTLHHLPHSWSISIVAQATSLPVYIMLLLVPLDRDLIPAIMQNPTTVAVAGLYGFAAAWKSIATMAANPRVHSSY